MISQTVSQFLDQRGVKYALLPHAETRTLEETAEAIGASYARMLRAVIVTEGTTCYMGVVPLTHVLGFKALHTHIGPDQEIAP